jgi:hypothetical protein
MFDTTAAAVRSEVRVRMPYAPVIGLPNPARLRFFGIAVSDFNAAHNPGHEYVFNPGTPNDTHLVSPDPGRALITGIGVDADPVSFRSNVNAFKISQLRAIRRTRAVLSRQLREDTGGRRSPLRQILHLVSNGSITLTRQDQADIVAYTKLLD